MNFLFSAVMRCWLLFASFVIGAAGIVQAEQVAFPGAIGYGANAHGWRGGDVITVQTLEDSGEGSLRACVEREGPRICVFQVSGTIELDSELRVASDVYIAGQTAPGDGIQLKLRNSIRSPILIKNANDVVIRYLKVRPGPSVEESSTVDGITIENAERVYIDHVSVMFATDENLNVHVSGGTSADITIANSILAFGLEKANHPKGRHSKGALICSHEGENNDCGRITLARNLFAHNRDRNPDLKATDLGPIEVINNVFYNAGSQIGEFYNNLGTARINYIGNVAVAGPNTRKEPRFAVEAFLLDEANPLKIFADDNLAFSCKRKAPFSILDPVAENQQLDAPAPLSATPRFAGNATRLRVLETVGDQIRDRRKPDALDALVLHHVRECGGRIIDDPSSDLGGWPEVPIGTGLPDGDQDGLPDIWEVHRPWLDPNDPDDSKLNVPDSHMSNLEYYLAVLAADI